jgi:hypothetical protein
MERIIQTPVRDASAKEISGFIWSRRREVGDQRTDVSFDPFFIARLRRMKARRAKEE